jgi:hypothetical protein
MRDWNYDLSQAPRGYYKKYTRTVKGKEVEYEQHIPELIIAAGNGCVVNLSRWLPEEGRWNMYTKEVPPKAWIPWPKHPEEA